MNQQNELFDAPPRYPDFPGAKVAGPSAEAAQRIAPQLGRLQAKVLKFYTDNFPCEFTADEAGKAEGLSPFCTRPRCTELKAKGLLEETPIRRKNESGSAATAWRASAKAMEAAHG